MRHDEDAEDSFAELYRRCFGRLAAQLYAITGDLGEAQEAVQEAFVRAWPRWPELRNYQNTEGWLYVVAHRVAVSRWRRTRRTVLGWLVREDDGTHYAGPDPSVVVLVEALRRLPEPQRRALVMHHMGDRSVAEIAETEGVPIGTVKARLSRGRAALASLLADQPLGGLSVERADVDRTSTKEVRRANRRP